MGYIGMCRGEGYGFQVVYSRIAYINQSVTLVSVDCTSLSSRNLWTLYFPAMDSSFQSL